MPHFEITKDDTGDFRWRFRAANGKILADSGEGYKAKADCLHAVDILKKHAAEARVDDQTAT